MKKMQLKRINDESVEAVPLVVAFDKRPLLGASLFSEAYSNIFLCARKKSGKSSVIYKIVKECANKHTTVIAFVSTLYKDDTWAQINKYCDDNGIHFIGYTSLKDDQGNDTLQELIKELEKETEVVVEAPKMRLNLNSHVDKPKTKKKCKYKSPEYLIILDDLSSELKSTSITTLLKKNRHFKSKIIVSSQYLNDLGKGSRMQIDYYLLFKGMSTEKIIEVYHQASVSLTKETFESVYKIATKPKYSFLYIDTVENEFRMNFNQQFINLEK